MIPFCNRSSTGSHDREREVELIGVMENDWGGPLGAGGRGREKERGREREKERGREREREREKKRARRRDEEYKGIHTHVQCLSLDNNNRHVHYTQRMSHMRQQLLIIHCQNNIQNRNYENIPYNTINNNVRASLSLTPPPFLSLFSLSLSFFPSLPPSLSLTIRFSHWCIRSRWSCSSTIPSY